MTKFLCSNCRHQMTGFDGGFFGLPLTCECRVFGETENRKDCKEWEKRISKNDLLNEIADLKKENEQLRQQVQNAKEIAVENDMQYQICRKEKEDFQDMCEQLRQEIKQYWKCRDKWKQEAKELKKENENLEKKLESLQKVLHLVECVSDE